MAVANIKIRKTKAKEKSPTSAKTFPQTSGFLRGARCGRTEGGDQTQLTCKTIKFQQQIAVRYDDPMGFWPSAMGPEQRLRSSCSAK